MAGATGACRADRRERDRAGGIGREPIRRADGVTGVVGRARQPVGDMLVDGRGRRSVPAGTSRVASRPVPRDVDAPSPAPTTGPVVPQGNRTPDFESGRERHLLPVVLGPAARK